MHCEICTPKSAVIDWSPNPLHAADIKAYSSASALDNAMIDCPLLFESMPQERRVATEPEVDFLLRLQPA